MRTASLVRSPAAAWDSVAAFTYVPMPPFQSKSTGRRRIARMISFGVAAAVSMPSSARASPGSVIDLALRSNTPPPRDSARLS